MKKKRRGERKNGIDPTRGDRLLDGAHGSWSQNFFFFFFFFFSLFELLPSDGETQNYRTGRETGKCHGHSNRTDAIRDPDPFPWQSLILPFFLPPLRFLVSPN